MKKLLSLLVLFVLKGTLSFSQQVTDSLLQAGNKFYKQKNYATAAPIWVKAAESADNNISKNTIYYYAANAFAAAKDTANSFKCLEIAIYKYGYNDIPAIKNDDAFAAMNSSLHWKRLLKAMKPAYVLDPLKVKITDVDVKNFWIAYDKVQVDTAHAASIYKKYYFDKGTIGLMDYFVNKMGNNLGSFTYEHKVKSKFYASIRANTFKAMTFKQQYIKSFVTLKKLYSDAIFPNLYFVIGKLNSAGTSTSNGLILSIDQTCKTSTTNFSELKSWELHYLNPLQELVPIVAHELTHFQQNSMASDTTLLNAAIVEGMADFMAEVMTGRAGNRQLVRFAMGKEQKIWADFKKEMYLDRKQNWIGNGDQDTPDHPADLGYWVGYRICKAYYNRTKNKKQAVYAMLHIQDYRKFLADSGFEEEIEKY